MWYPQSNMILVSHNKNSHLSSYINCKNTGEKLPDFEKWIRFIHLRDSDFSIIGHTPLLCIRTYDNEATFEDVNLLIKTIGIESEVIFNIDNDKLRRITGFYNEKY